MIFKLRLRNLNGLWFYGLSGSGKSLFSKILNKNIKNSIIVDGDNVRKIISNDLGYSQKDREIQINRIFGISKLIIESKKFPIASSVFMNKKIHDLCKKNKIKCIMVVRENFNNIKKNHKTYRNKSNVVGKDIFFESFKKSILINDNTPISFKII